MLAHTLYTADHVTWFSINTLRPSWLWVLNDEHSAESLADTCTKEAHLDSRLLKRSLQPGNIPNPLSYIFNLTIRPISSQVLDEFQIRLMGMSGGQSQQTRLRSIHPKSKDGARNEQSETESQCTTANRDSRVRASTRSRTETNPKQQQKKTNLVCWMTESFTDQV